MFTCLVKTAVLSGVVGDTERMAWFKRTITMPFPPTPGIYLDFQTDDESLDGGIVDEVTWNVATNMFTVYIEGHEQVVIFDELCESLVNHGWDVDDDCPWVDQRSSTNGSGHS